MLTSLYSAARAGLAACLVLAVLGFSLPAWAWKPITHVYLAEKARAELLAQNGSISLHQVDFYNRQQAGLIGTYPVSSHVYQALRDYPAYFRAGVLGPDAYPDMLFGQAVIHPATNDDGSDTDPWLRHLYSKASTPQQRAFVLGFFSHAAGDMFGHTFINHYAKGPFALGDNARRHIVAEGHVGRRTPFLGDLSYGDPARYTIDTSAVNTFIYDNMIDARRSRDGSWSNDVWRLTRDTQAASLPRLFTELRAGLEDKIEAYYAHVRWLKQQYRDNADRCRWYRPGPCFKAAYYKVLLVAYNLIASLPVYYMEAWVRDINRGLKAWPATSTQVARELFMKTDHKGNFEGARTVLSTYSDRYLCSMLGAPDAVCTLSSIIENIISAITFKLDLFKALKQAILNYAVKKATGHELDYWKTLMDPEPYQVDQEVPANPLGPTSSQQLDQLMWVSGSPARFNMLKFAPAYNTYAAIKMSFLDTRTQWKSVLGAAGWNPPNLDSLMDSYDSQNNGFGGQLLLGFIRSMDWDNQWAVPKRMFIAQDCMLFTRFFMQQTGDLWGDPLRQNELTAWCEGNPATPPGEPVGVIPAGTSCPTTSSTVSFFMDNQDNGGSYVSGWVGGTSLDGNRNTRLVFCRVGGNQFRSLASYSTGRANYAVLKLGASCPPGSVEFSRYFDNEDDNNKNSYTGTIWPNTSSSYGTELRFCLFKGDGTTSTTLPNVGFDYGVFAGYDFGFTSARGVIYTDDENSSNANRYAPDTSTSWRWAAVSIVSAGTDTTMRTARAYNPWCGDSTCNGLETESSCPRDCDYCGNGSCSASESLYSCPRDCGWCGDGYCAPGESCSLDCGTTCQSGQYIERCELPVEM